MYRLGVLETLGLESLGLYRRLENLFKVVLVLTLRVMEQRKLIASRLLASQAMGHYGTCPLDFQLCGRVFTVLLFQV